MAAPRPFVIVLLVIAALLVIFFVLALTGIFAPPHAKLDDLRTSFSGHHLRRHDLRAEGGCLGNGDQLQVKAGTVCVLVAPKSSDPVWKRRSVVLKSSSAIEVTVKPVDTDERTVDGKPDAGKEAEFYVGRAGAQIEIACLGGTCPVTLQP